MFVTHHGRTDLVLTEADALELCARYRPSLAAEDRRLQLVYRAEELEQLQVVTWQRSAPRTTFAGCFA